MKCVICDNEQMVVSWTDTHGIGQCTRCGAPYRIYHYDENNKRQKKPPVCIISEDWLKICQGFWAETNRPMPSGCSFPGGREVANAEDVAAWNEWNDKRTSVLQEAEEC